MTTKIIGPSGEYPSIRQAARDTGLSRDAVAYLSASEIDGWWRTGPVPPPTTGRAVIGQDGKRFASVKAAARVVKRPAGTVRDWCQRQTRGWRYEDEPLRPKGPRKAEGFELLDQLGPVYADDVRVRVRGCDHPRRPPHPPAPHCGRPPGTSQASATQSP